MALTQSRKESVRRILDEHLGHTIDRMIETGNIDQLNRMKIYLMTGMIYDDGITEEGKSYAGSIITEYIMKIDDFLNK